MQAAQIFTEENEAATQKSQWNVNIIASKIIRLHQVSIHLVVEETIKLKTIPAQPHNNLSALFQSFAV